jgi:NAD(P)-dependent dehydrogenase (short-subunit alcohol dehydrogenase family)
MGLLDDKVAIVTGVGRPRGIGEATALKFAREGADVVVSDICREYEGDMSFYPLGGMDHLQKVVKKIEETGRKGLAFQVDITKKEEVQSMVEGTVKEFGKLDILVNNAGSAVGVGPFLTIDERAWDKTFDVNVKGTFYCMRAAIPEMLKIGQGRIVNVSSTSGLRGALNYGAYDASKFAVTGMTQTAAAEFAPQNILINCVCPGSVDTSLTQDEMEFFASALDATPEELKEMESERIAIGRWAVGEDIANVICFLASPMNTYMVGQAVSVEGGKEFMGEKMD